MTENPPVPQKHYFSLKGQAAEEFLQELANHTFLADWCYANPLLPTGKELCDLLVVFDSTAIIWQVKSLKLSKNGRLRQSEIDKNLRQLSGARRQLFKLKTPLTLQNSRRASELFDPNTIQEVFLLSVLLGDTPGIQALDVSVDKHPCHVFTRDFTELLLNELDTVADFCAYLREKERIRSHVGSFILEGDERELLGYYLFNERSFAKLEGHTAVFIEEGTWTDLQTQPKYLAKREADAISYLWDEIVERAHTGDSPFYERIARELARPCRFDRRCLAQRFYDAHVLAHENASPDGTFRRVIPTQDTTYCFLYTGDNVSRENRCKLLSGLCYVARGQFPKQAKVLGIATEMVIRSCSSLDYCLLDIAELTLEQRLDIKRLQDQTGILTNVTQRETTDCEYPEID